MSQGDLLSDAPLPDDALARLDDADVRQAWPRNLVAMVDVVMARLRRAGVDEATARSHAAMTMHALSEYHGGRQFYLPKGDTLEIALRNKRIWDEFTGHNVEHLSERYGLTFVQVYNILREQRALHRKRVQPDLFPSDN
jgi:Mor family transcriptional regulator